MFGFILEITKVLAYKELETAGTQVPLDWEGADQERSSFSKCDAFKINGQDKSPLEKCFIGGVKVSLSMGVE